MNGAETRYSVHEQELLALVRTLEANRHYLLGRHFRAFTDHKSLIFLQEQAHLSRRQANWVELLQQYDFSVEYLPGEWNTVADVLSRNPYYAPKCATCAGKVSVFASLVGTELKSAPRPGSPGWLSVSASDDETLRIRAHLEPPSSGRREKHLLKFHLDNENVLRYEGRAFVPDALRGALLFEEHDSLLKGGHSGISRTVAKLRAQYYWPRMADDVAAFIASCDKCQRIKDPVRTMGLLNSMPTPAGRWEQLGMDIAYAPATASWGGRKARAESFDAILVVVDYLSSRICLIPTTRTAKATEIAHLFWSHVGKYFGVPKVLISDRDSKWTSEFWFELLKMLQIRQELSTARHQQTDGKTERAIRTVKHMLKPYLNYAGSNWADLLPMLEFNFNRTPNLSGLSPFEIDLGRVPSAEEGREKLLLNKVRNAADKEYLAALRGSLEKTATIARESLLQSQRAQKQHYDKRREEQQFATGDQVLLNRAGIQIKGITDLSEKLAERWIGPFAITKPGEHPDTYELALTPQFKALHPVFHTRILKPYVDPAASKHRDVQGAPGPVRVNGEDEYEIEDVISERRYYGKTRYLVKWKGYASSQNSEVDREDIEGTAAFDRWLQKRASEPTSRRSKEAMPSRRSGSHRK